jgi:mono/diheme cytochrome c family protein
MRCTNRRATASVLAAGLVGVLASCASRDAASSGQGGPAAIASSHPGAPVYVHECQSCHGARGRGDGAAARKANIDVPDLTDPETASQSDDELFTIVTRGHKPMPAFRDRLSDRERWDVVRYVRAAFAPAGAGKS